MNKFLKTTYLILSGISFVLVFGILVLFIFSYTPIGMSYSPNPVFTLNHGNITTEQNFEVIYSQQSPPVLNGDHLDFYCIQLEKFEFQSPNESEWIYGKESNPLFSEARKQTSRMADIANCFDGETNAESENIASKIWSIHAGRNHLEGAVVIMYHKPTNRLLYVSFQT